MIIGLLWIIVSSPIWIILSVTYLVIKWFYLIFIAVVKIIFSILFLLIKGFKEGSDYQSDIVTDIIQSIMKNMFSALFNFLSSLNDVLINFWEFGRYDHPYWALFISFFLIYIYFKIYDMLTYR